jgi:hypothetical protein
MLGPTLDPYTPWSALLGDNTRYMQKKLREKLEELAFKSACDELAEDPTYKRLWLSSSAAKAGAWVTRILCYKTFLMTDRIAPAVGTLTGRGVRPNRNLKSVSFRRTSKWVCPRVNTYEA